MRCATYAIFSCLKKRWDHVKYIAVFCGNGNNAGDEYLIVPLALPVNIQVSLYNISPIGKLTG